MVETKGLSATRANWEGAVGRVPSAYKKGIERSTGFVAKAMAGEDLWIAAITDAAGRRAREKGLSRISDAEWKSAAAVKGAARIGPGMSASKEKYARRMGEVLSVIEGVSIGPRTTDASANVDARVKPIAVALQDWKKGR